MPDSSVTLQGDYNYQPDPSYTDPLGAVVPSDTSYDPLEIQKMRAALEAKNKTQQMSIHEMGSNFLNNAKSVTEPIQKFIDQTGITAPGQVAAALATSFPSFLLHGFGSTSTNPETQKQLRDLAQQVQYEPTSPMAQNALKLMSDAQETLMIPPYVPGIGLRAGDARTFTPADLQVLGAKGINTARELKAVPQDFNVGRQGFNVLNSLGEPTIGSKLGAFENKVIGEPQRQKLKKAASNVPEDVSYDALRQRVNENYEPGMPMFSVKGPSAKTWDIDAIKAAEDMKSKNLPDPLTHKVTGSWKGPDNKWRQEISDDKASLNQRTFNDLQNYVGKKVTAPLKSFLNHSEFFDAYPDAQNIKVVVGPFGEKFRAAYSHANNAIYIDESEVAKGPNEVLKNLIHELTHHVQNVEGFERGANINEFPEDKDIIVAQELENVMSAQKVPLQEAVRQYTLYNGSPPSLDAIEYAERGQGNIIKNPGKEARYSRVYGEAESESMEDRMHLTAEQRREHYPLEQQSFRDLIDEKPSYGIKFNPKHTLIRVPGSSDFISAEQFKKQGYTHTPLAIDNTELPPDLEMAIKEKGGNWIESRVDRILKPLRQSLMLTDASDPYSLSSDWRERANDIGYSPAQQERMLSSHAINQWVDKRLKNYIKNDMGTPKDPVRDLADQGITHIQGLGDHFAQPNPNDNGNQIIKGYREHEGQPPEGYATTHAGKEWEFQTDWATHINELKEYAQNLPKQVASQEGLLKALDKDPEATVYTPSSKLTRDLGFEHLTDELRNAVEPETDLPQQLRITTKDLERMTVPDAVRLVSKINKYRADLAEKATVKNVGEFRQNFPALKTYDNGMAWHELKEPDYVSGTLPQGYTIGSEDTFGHPDMRHILRPNGQPLNPHDPYLSHEEALKEGPEQIAYQQLDDALKEEGELMGHCVGGYTNDVTNGSSRIFTLRDAKGKPHVTIQTNPAKGFEDIDEPYHDVAQIKGKGNKQVSSKYRAEVLDFLNNAYPHSELVGVEELYNINAVDMQSPSRQIATPTLRDAYVNKVNAVKQAYPDLPRFIDNDEMHDLYTKINPPEGHKDGGYIQHFQSGGSVESDSRFPIQAHVRSFQSPDLLDIKDYGVTARSPQPGSFPPLFPEIVGEGAHQLRESLFNANAMNISNPAYTLGLKQINAPREPTFPGDDQKALSVAGFYNSSNPGQVTLNPNAASKASYDVAPFILGHEAHHQQDVETRPALNPPNYQRLYNKYYLQRNIEKNFQQQQENLPIDARGFGYSMQNNVPWEERLADLAGYEAALPKGKTLLDTEFGKKVFNTPALRKYYLESVRPMEAKAFPVEDTLYEKAKEKYHKFQGKVGEGKSYADAAYETVLNKKDGGSIKSLDQDKMKFELMMRKR